MERAELARSFVAHPYWSIVSKMLSGTIHAETEEMLRSDDHLAVNRASVAMCRKILNMPYFDIKQGEAAEAAHERARARYGLKTQARVAREV